MYDSRFGGPADVNDSTHDVDRLDLLESIESLGQNASRSHAQEIPRYAEMVSVVFDKTGWRPEEFRGYRCRIQYPFYGSQVYMTFELPEAPKT